MSTATLASDSDVSLPSRLPGWVTRILARASGKAPALPARWSFLADRSKQAADVSAVSPQALVHPAGVSTADAPVSEIPSAAVRPVVATPVRRMAVAVSLDGTVSAGLSADVPVMPMQAAHSQSMGTAGHALNQGLTVRQMVTDVLLVAMWGALIPGLMWLGAAAGF